ncbi:MAG: hypothetical protein JST92_22940 [Deltaproteobacteria bacterium]|nr:hypothetical protein [Deltaproteobacteria bacterium]
MRALALLLAAVLVCPRLARAQEPERTERVYLREEPQRDALVRFSGNIVCNDFLLRAQLALPDTAKADAATARQIVVKLTRFLRASGYELAQVDASVVGDHINVTIDEGRLDKLQIIGDSTVNAFRLRLELALPGDVFNRPLIEQRLQRLAGRFNLNDISYELLEEHIRDLPATQLDQIGALSELKELGLLRKPASHTLRIFVQPDEWGSGVSPEVILGGLDGYGAGAQLKGTSLLFAGDRWALHARGAVAPRNRLDTGDAYLAFSRAKAQSIWFGPQFDAFKQLRFLVQLESDLVSQQRAQLQLERYYTETVEATFGLSDQLTRRLLLEGSGGYQLRWLFGLDGPTSTQVAGTPSVQRRPFVEVGEHLVFNPDELRVDHRNFVDGRFRFFSPTQPGGSVTAAGEFRARGLIPFGWNELWLEGNVRVVTGDRYFTDEYSLGDVMANVYSEVFTHRLAQAGAEFRVSLLRDVFKVGLLLNVAAYGSDPNNTGADVAQAASALGFGFHWLVLDTFTADLIVSAAIATNQGFAPALSFNLSQVF